MCLDTNGKTKTKNLNQVRGRALLVSLNPEEEGATLSGVFILPLQTKAEPLTSNES